MSALFWVKKDDSSLAHYSLENLLQWKVSSQKNFAKSIASTHITKSKCKLAALATFKN